MSNRELLLGDSCYSSLKLLPGSYELLNYTKLNVLH